MNGKKQIPYIQWLRMFAALAVVVMHTEGSLWPAMAGSGRDFAVLTAWDALVRWPVPVFVMITGALFLSRKTELKQILTRYIPRMAAAFFFWSGVYALRGGTEGLTERFVTCHYHLWYLPFACGLYLTIPFLQAIAKDGRLTRQLLWVSLTIGALVPWLAELGALCVPEWSGILASLKNSLHFTFFFDLLGVVLLGHVLTLWASARSGGPNPIFCQITAPTTLAAAAAFFVFAKYALTRLPGAVAWLADRSFGVYLCHALILELLADRGIHALAADPVWTVPGIAAAVFVLSLALTELLRRVPVIGKILV